MNALLIGLYGVYLLLVGFAGNSKTLLTEVKADAPGFLPWAVSIGVLGAMYEFPETRKVAAPFLLLLALTFVLRNFDTLQTQFRELYSMAANAAANQPKE